MPISRLTSWHCCILLMVVMSLFLIMFLILPPYRAKTTNHLLCHPQFGTTNRKEHNNKKAAISNAFPSPTQMSQSMVSYLGILIFCSFFLSLREMSVKWAEGQLVMGSYPAGCWCHLNVLSDKNGLCCSVPCLFSLDWFAFSQDFHHFVFSVVEMPPLSWQGVFFFSNKCSCLKVTCISITPN